DATKYQVVFESKVHGVKFYTPANDTDYHLSRYVAAGAQNIYSSAGATREVLEAIADNMLQIVNADGNRTPSIKTDIGVLANNIKYRLKYPVDEDCAIRMGAIYCFMDGENPDEMHDLYTRKKMDYAKGSADGKIPADPELYSFFLTLGVQSTPAW